MPSSPKILITGATGFLGSRVAARLAEEGIAVRALVRRSSDVSQLKTMGVELAYGDLGDLLSVCNAMDGVSSVVHAGAGTDGTEEGANTGTIQGTRNILEACKRGSMRKLVYISSCSVYDIAGLSGTVVTETESLERFPGRRGHYSAAKQQAEIMVTEAMKDSEFSIVVLRPGTLYGAGADVYSRMMGAALGEKVFLVFGNGSSGLPVAHVDNVVDAIVESMKNPAADGEIFNVVDGERVSKKLYMARVIKPLYPKSLVFYCPLSLIIALTWLQEKMMLMIGRRPILTVYRLISSQRPVRYSSAKIESVLGWRARVGFIDGAERLVREHRNMSK